MSKEVVLCVSNAYDEIGSVLKIKQYQSQKRELLEAIETYYRIVFLGEGFEEE